MKHTIKADGGKALVIEPDAGGFKATITFHGMPVGSMVITPDQWGVMVFAGNLAIEQRAECIEVIAGTAPC